VRGFSVDFLTEAEAAALRQNGLPVGTDTARALTSERVLHAWNEHGPPASRPDGAPPITVEDLASWRQFIAGAIDRQRTITDRGQPAMTYLARDDQGGLVVVEEFRNRTGILAFNNMFRLPPNHGARKLEDVAGMRERMRRAAMQNRPGPSVPAAARRPEQTSETTGLTRCIPPAIARFQTFTAAGRGILVEPRVVELDTLVPSNLDDFTPNPAYPHREGVQPRDRSRESDQQWVRETAASINPELLGRSATADAGAPIVGPDNVVESGNGRIMALRRAAREHPEVWANYQAWLADQGFDLAAYRQPVLVMDRISALTATERALFVTEANAPTAARREGLVSAGNARTRHGRAAPRGVPGLSRLGGTGQKPPQRRQAGRPRSTSDGAVSAPAAAPPRPPMTAPVTSDPPVSAPTAAPAPAPSPAPDRARSPRVWPQPATGPGQARQQGWFVSVPPSSGARWRGLGITPGPGGYSRQPQPSPSRAASGRRGQGKRVAQPTVVCGGACGSPPRGLDLTPRPSGATLSLLTFMRADTARLVGPDRLGWKCSLACWASCRPTWRSTWVPPTRWST
jgi:hypothetical protein